jgi:hypothetical protein
MPAHALGLSEYFSGTMSCKICDNEHSTATLGDSEEPCVQHSPCDVQRPDVCQRIEDCCEVSPLRATEGTDDVLPNNPSWIPSIACLSHFLDDSDGLIEEDASLAIEPGSLPGDTEVLAG